MADLESNIDSVEAQIEALVNSVKFTMTGKDGSLGEDMVGVIAQGIIDRTVAEQRSSDGGTLKANEPRYRALKRQKYGVDQPLVRTGQMLSLESVTGSVTITDDEITMTYGTGKAPTGSSTGYISEQDKQVTDREKADWTADERPFYGLDESIAADVWILAGEMLIDLLEKF